jgi:hypothetical protein
MVHKFNRYIQGDWTPNSEEGADTEKKKLVFRGILRIFLCNRSLPLT